jgi:hypothetical protein
MTGNERQQFVTNLMSHIPEERRKTKALTENVGSETAAAASNHERLTNLTLSSLNIKE